MNDKLIKVLICGDRNHRPEYDEIVNREIVDLVRQFGVTNLLIIEGGAPGVDSLAKKYAKLNNVHCATIEALWETRGRGAGPQRNKIMAQLWPNLAIAVHHNIEESRGTKSMVDIINKMGMKPKLVNA